jgi:arginase
LLPVYISFDVDVLDPAFAPGVSHREPGGMTAGEAIAHLHAIEGTIVGADVVEFNPRWDISGVTATELASTGPWPDFAVYICESLLLSRWM